MSKLLETIASTCREWAGSKPGTLRRGSQSRRLMFRLPCEGCGAEVERTPYELRKWAHTACSPACKMTVYWAGHQERTVPCRECGKPFKRKTGQKHCSRACAGVSNQKSTDPKIRRNAYFRKHLRPLVLDRDGRVCAICASPLALLVHHIDEDWSNNEMSNLITLCNTCHGKHHHSPETAFSGLSGLAEARSKSMTSRLKERLASLQEVYSPTTA